MISGTSRDGADAALVRFESHHAEIEAAVCIPYSAELTRSLDRLIRAGQRPDASLQKQLDIQLADHFSETVRQLLDQTDVNPSEVTAIGSHGQTVWHHPEGPEPESIQLGSPELIAEKTGIVTVGDFRRADIEAGGQGAPLAPLLHLALFRPAATKSPVTRVVLNLGGIANISVLDRAGAVSGYDTGPANCLLDAWIHKSRAERFDKDGAWAAGGTILPVLLQQMLADPYFRQPPPKSTGIEYFNLAWLAQHQPDQYRPGDVQASLAELTAITVAESVRGHTPEDLLVCGGGVHNAWLMSRLENHLQGVPIRSTAEFGLDPDWVEAVLFAWLARERLANRPQATRDITGASGPVLLGVIANPPRSEPALG
ncbi:MAG: anhydro-N-acetylmuramic acid kinase [Xanthomonadales bacterium]|nr:anhydro-N-acetylmuramic acid kinase [Gammaproteobacteria bacterium]MBT8054246.1 anhydro-N-acetylmuramic acid kinase [Gammaproteobacteria bacterium]NND57561.1 anhydro-N-acetylmuramic acid kinase [Xanthomonadales bacterium]NNK51285.1 anhydro-N-acetylmuramic acid kinase [Xanthomonadales bacterium]